MDEAKKGYYYLHTNGELIFKVAYVVDNLGATDYFDSPFVRRYWRISTEEQYNQMMQEVEKLKKEEA